ncbi:MAG: hypothetical protein HY815_02795 [Candidatus Riflebacteria bacterium]|nr:hypothetical protein [Candidatus Riflebacteria bacterium]
MQDYTVEAGPVMKSIRLVCLTLGLITLGAAAVLAGPSSRPVMPREVLLEKLVDAQRTFDSWNIAGAKSRLDRLSAQLTDDASAYNQAARGKIAEIVGAIAASQLADAGQKLHKLVIQVRDGVMPSATRRR